jgi:hypothetical protein
MIDRPDSAHDEHPNQELITIGQIREEIVEIRSSLRFAKDELERRRRAVEKAVLTSLTVKLTDKDKTREVEWALDDDGEYQSKLRAVRVLEHRQDQYEAFLARAIAPLRKEEWLTRQHLADAILAYASRPCVGDIDHTIIDTAIDATGEDGVFRGESDYVDETSFAF